MAELAVDPAWHVIGASVRGTSHQRRDQPCQDAHAFRITPDGVLLVAVADGAGSAERSDAGSQHAVEAVIAALETALATELPESENAWEALLVEAYGAARQAVLELAEIEQRSPRAFATTLTCAVVAFEWLVVGQIGDGIVVMREENGQLFAATEPQHGEYVNETYFLTMPEALTMLEVQSYERNVTALALMTDGLIRLAIQTATNEPHVPFFEPLFAFVSQMNDGVKAQEQLATLLASERVCERTDDDKTLVLVARPSQTEARCASEEDVGTR